MVGEHLTRNEMFVSGISRGVITSCFRINMQSAQGASGLSDVMLNQGSDSLFTNTFEESL